MKPEQFFAPCPRGLSDVLSQELAALGATQCRPAEAGVAFEAPLARIKNKHRWQVLVKAHSRPEARDALDLALGRLEETTTPVRAISIEVDPVSLM